MTTLYTKLNWASRECVYRNPNSPINRFYHFSSDCGDTFIAEEFDERGIKLAKIKIKREIANNYELVAKREAPKLLREFYENYPPACSRSQPPRSLIAGMKVVLHFQSDLKKYYRNRRKSRKVPSTSTSIKYPARKIPHVPNAVRDMPFQLHVRGPAPSYTSGDGN